MFYADHSVKLNDLDLNKVHVFFAVVAEGGVGKAAQRLGRTSSAVSQSIASLESTLGCKLFDRVGKALVLTRSGQHLHASLREFQATLARTIAEVARQDDEVQGVVRIGCFLGFPRIRLAELAARFIEEYPKASLRVVYAPQDDLVERLRAQSAGLRFLVPAAERGESARHLDRALRSGAGAHLEPEVLPAWLRSRGVSRESRWSITTRPIR